MNFVDQLCSINVPGKLAAFALACTACGPVARFEAPRTDIDPAALGLTEDFDCSGNGPLGITMTDSRSDYAFSYVGSTIASYSSLGALHLYFAEHINSGCRLYFLRLGAPLGRATPHFSPDAIIGDISYLQITGTEAEGPILSAMRTHDPSCAELFGEVTYEILLNSNCFSAAFLSIIADGFVIYVNRFTSSPPSNSGPIDALLVVGQASYNIN